MTKKKGLTLRLRHLAKRFPGVVKIYTFLRVIFSASYNEDGLMAVRNCAFLGDKRFQSAFDKALEQHPGMEIRWRAHVAQWAGFQAARLEGDFVECGVNRGFLSRSVMEYVRFEDLLERKFYLFDTFSGLVPEQISPEDRGAYWNEYDDCYAHVVEAFKSFRNVVIVKGAVPESLTRVKIDRVAYLSIDMNCAYPELEALKYFWPKMTEGGIIIVDDYAFVGHEAQQRSADEFARSVGTKVLTLPTGQGLIVKH